MGELHLEIIVDRLKREYSVDANVGKPQVAYRETIRRPAKGEEKYARQTGGRGQYGHAVLEIEPAEPGTGFEFVNEIVGGAIPKEYIPAVEKGVVEAMEGGIIAGYEMVDIKVRLVYGSYHEVDSSEMAFKIAGSIAFKNAARSAQPGASRACNEGRDRDAGRVHGFDYRRPEFATRTNRVDELAAWRTDHCVDGAACRDVRL